MLAHSSRAGPIRCIIQLCSLPRAALPAQQSFCGDVRCRERRTARRRPLACSDALRPCLGFPAADYVEDAVPRLLINREKAGELTPEMRALGYRRGFNFGDGNYRCAAPLQRQGCLPGPPVATAACLFPLAAAVLPAGAASGHGSGGRAPSVVLTCSANPRSLFSASCHMAPHPTAIHHTHTRTHAPADHPLQGCPVPGRLR